MPLIPTGTGVKEFPYTREGISAARTALKTSIRKGVGRKRIMTSDGFMPRKGTNQMTKPAAIPSSSKSGQELVAGVENLRNYGKGMVAGAATPNMESMKGMGGRIIDSVGSKVGAMAGNLDKKLGTNTASMVSEQIAKAKSKFA